MFQTALVIPTQGHARRVLCRSRTWGESRMETSGSCRQLSLALFGFCLSGNTKRHPGACLCTRPRVCERSENLLLTCRGLPSRTLNCSLPAACSARHPLTLCKESEETLAGFTLGDLLRHDAANLPQLRSGISLVLCSDLYSLLKLFSDQLLKQPVRAQTLGP